jgi:hypothetical protein
MPSNYNSNRSTSQTSLNQSRSTSPDNINNMNGTFCSNNHNRNNINLPTITETSDLNNNRSYNQQYSMLPHNRRSAHTMSTGSAIINSYSSLNQTLNTSNNSGYYTPATVGEMNERLEILQMQVCVSD